MILMEDVAVRVSESHWGSLNKGSDPDPVKAGNSPATSAWAAIVDTQG